MGVFRNTVEKVEEYRQCPRINQSLLKVLLQDGLEVFLEKRDDVDLKADIDVIEKTHFLIGNAVDFYISFGHDAFTERYFYSQLPKKPSDTEMLIIRKVMTKVSSEMVKDNENPDTYRKLSQYREQIYEALNTVEYTDKSGKQKIGYYMNRKPKSDRWEDDTRFDSLASVKNGLAQLYWQELISAEGKIILSDAEAAVIMGQFNEDGAVVKPGIIQLLFNHPFTSHLFEEDTEGIDTVFQFICYTEVDGVKVKGLLDMVRINHKARRIMPIDIKTLGESVLKFNNSARVRRYDFQGAFYSKLLSLSLNELSELIRVDVTNYEIAPFAFIAASTKYLTIPLIFPLDSEMMRHGEIGDGRRYQGYAQALSLYKDWESFNFDLTERFTDTRGIIHIQTDYNYSQIF